MRNQRGQILVFVLLSVLSLAMLWFMTVNIGKMIKDRVMMQNAADAAAQTAACIRARGLNITGELNSILGIPVFTLGIPKFVWWPCHHCNFCWHFDICDCKARAARKFVRSIIKTQDSIRKTYGGGLAFLYAREVARMHGADEIVPVPPYHSFSLRQHRNTGDIWYWGSLNFGWLEPAPPPVWVKHEHIGPLPIPPQICGIHEIGANRWLEQWDTFHKKKQIITAIKYEKATPGFPLGRKLLGIKKMPEIVTSAASRPYCAAGPMFPQKGQWWNIPAWLGCGGILAWWEYMKCIWQGKQWEAQIIPVGGPYQH